MLRFVVGNILYRFETVEDGVREYKREIHNAVAFYRIYPRVVYHVTSMDMNAETDRRVNLQSFAEALSISPEEHQQNIQDEETSLGLDHRW